MIIFTLFTKNVTNHQQEDHLHPHLPPHRHHLPRGDHGDDAQEDDDDGGDDDASAEADVESQY